VSDSQSLAVVPGSTLVTLVAPHAHAPAERAVELVIDDPGVQHELLDRIADWHDEGSREALDAANAATGWTALRPTLPRGLVDVNRGWRGRQEEKETLFGKGAVDQWIRASLRPGSLERLESWHRRALDQIRTTSAESRGIVELHSYGDLGSTYDRHAGGRPVRRSEAAVVHGAPWANAYPVGIARLIPASLRGTPWALERLVGDALAGVGINVGPSPYPTTTPWAVSPRFLADRWFRWLGRTGRIPAATADHLATLAWTEEQDEEVDAAAEGTAPEPAHLKGARALARRLGAWSHEGGALGDAFSAEDPSFTLVVELRVDLVERAPEVGAAVARAVRSFIG
jgi:hypothetical protein